MNLEIISQLQQSRVAVVGLGLTGMSMLRFLRKHNVAPVVFDTRETPKVADKDQSLLQGLHCQFGEIEENALTPFDFVLVSPGIPLAIPALQKAKAQNDNVFGDVELFARINQKPVLAVTGSNGKSTVVAWLQDALNRAGKRAVACGNYGVPVLDVLEQDYDVFVIELSSFQLESTSSLRCEAATVLNVSEDHLDRYDSFADYSSAKNNIYHLAKSCLYNQDDFETKPLISHNDVSSFGFLALCHENTCWQFDSASGDLLKNKQRIGNFSDFAISGEHNALNALAVLALAERVGIDLVADIEHFYPFTGLPHRCQFVTERAQVSFIDDSKATNIASTQAALQGLATGKNIVLIAGGDAKGADVSELSADFSRSVKHLITLGVDGPKLAKTMEDVMAKNMAESSNEAVTQVSDMTQAVAVANEVAEQNDIVLLSPACASIDMFANYVARGLAFQQAVLALDPETGQ